MLYAWFASERRLKAGFDKRLFQNEGIAIPVQYSQGTIVVLILDLDISSFTWQKKIGQDILIRKRIVQFLMGIPLWEQTVARFPSPGICVEQKKRIHCAARVTGS
jgi:hypothetical protein